MCGRCYNIAYETLYCFWKDRQSNEQNQAHADGADDRRFTIMEKDEMQTGYTLEEGSMGQVQIADEVVAIIAGLAATEVEGVASMAGNITKELVSKLGKKSLSKGIRVDVEEGVVHVQVALNIAYGYSVPKTCKKVQEKVKTAIENMTGLEVSRVDIQIANVSMSKEK